ncbi:MAG: AraC family transcriptional regulator ligand-binding domain-containing protein, partial [Pseudomonadales bacterium]
MSRLPLVRCQFLLPFAAIHNSLGAPTESLLDKFKLPLLLHGKGDNYIPARNAIYFIEAAARTQGISDFGYLAAQSLKFEQWHPNARTLILQSPTLLYALRAVCSRAHVDATNLAMHLEFHGKALRICSRLTGSTGSQHLEHIQWIQNMLPIQLVRQFAGLHWAPETIAFEAPTHPSLNIQEQWPKTRFLSGQKTSWIDVPAKYLSLPPLASTNIITSINPQDISSPNDLIDSLKLMLPSYIDEKVPTISQAAEIANMSMRSFQRNLANTGWSYREVINMVRFERAVHLLKKTD